MLSALKSWWYNNSTKTVAIDTQESWDRQDEEAIQKNYEFMHENTQDQPMQDIDSMLSLTSPRINAGKQLWKRKRRKRKKKKRF